MDRDASSTRLIVPLTASTVEQMRADMAAAAAAGADAVECRLDYLAEPPTKADLAKLLANAPIEVIATNRPASQGGRFAGDESQRLAILRAAADSGASLVDVERGVAPADWPDGPIILSHHDFDRCPDDLDAIVAELAASDAGVIKVAFGAAGPEDALRALDVLAAAEKAKRPAIALAMGDAGLASRILARKFGAFGTFASLAAGAESAPGQPTIAQIKQLYRWDAIGPQTAVFGVIGCPVEHSMSPAIHNAAFAAAGLDAVYLPLLIQPGADNFKRFCDAVGARPWVGWRGLSVTLPHKENAFAYVGADSCDELARLIGAINTITIGPDGKLRGDNADYAAAIDALCDAMGIAREDLAGRCVAVLGAGGAARAIVAALAHYGAEVTIYNRTVSRSLALAAEFDCRAASIDKAGAAEAEIVINCTSVGMRPAADATPLPVIPPSVRVVFDTIYNPLETLLLRTARQAGCVCVTGLEMFVNQAATQFELWTDAPAPRGVMRQIVLDRLA